MNNDEQKYLDLMKHILEHGIEKEDRTGVGTKSCFGTQLRFSLEQNTLPMLTTKRIFSRGVIEELLFFIRGDTDTKKLEALGVNIWKGNTSREFLDKRGLNHLPVGSMGKGYGAQWRRFGEDKSDPATTPMRWSYSDVEGVDQLKNALHLLKTEPSSRKIIVSAWNPQQLDQMALEPCHCFFQFYVVNGELSCQFSMRSTDTFLGLPFNVMSYSILTHLMAKTAGLKAKEVIFSGGDVHLYRNHLEQAKEQISREPYPFPTLQIHKDITSIEDMEKLKFEDFEIVGYQSHPAIKAEMAV